MVNQVLLRNMNFDLPASTSTVIYAIECFINEVMTNGWRIIYTFGWLEAPKLYACVELIGTFFVQNSAPISIFCECSIVYLAIAVKWNQ